MMRSPVKPLVILMTTLSASVQAADLTDVANAAWSYDGTWRAERQNWEADQETLVQGRAALLPTIDASYGRYRTNQRIEDGGVDLDYDREASSVNLTQPLFRLDAFYGYKEAKATVSVSQANFYQARQDFVLRVAQGYFGVLRAWDNLVSAQAEEKAISRQLDQTSERFDVGLVPRTDVEEAQAAYDLTRVSLIVAEQDFAIARDQLETLTGQRWDNLAELREELPMSGPAPENMDAWLDKAAYQNPQILASRFTAKAAGCTADRQFGAMMPQVQLVGSYTHLHTAPDDDTGGATGFGSGITPDNHGTEIGIEVTMPLFRGGALNSQRKQAVLRADAADQTYLQTVRDVTQQARSAFRTVQADSLRVQARNQAIRSASSALEATQSGYEVGTRNVVDVLNAQQALYAAQRDYANARYDYILNSLTLQSAAGDLDVQNLVSVNEWLSSEQTLDLYNPDLEGQSEEKIVTPR
ncbi:TolC family outer membrane protein [Alloalcanivorax mobilis]|uniref:TolC family outer membrane protein n=1 Tax=Alloalcanivorax mobilis TaxID=2019569 RepID=UPI000C78BA79|nr:TolC family outer membrane protein [Alloalcanivorax mobilis]